MRKALMVMLSITVAVIVASQADAKGNKVSMGMIKFTKHYDKSSPYLSRQQTGSTPKPTTSGSSQMKGRR
jgi:type VI protein secretion system component Hcp